MKYALAAAFLGLAVLSTSSFAEDSKADNKAPSAQQKQDGNDDKAAKNKPIHREGHHHMIEHKANPDEPAKQPKKPLHDHRESK